MKYQFNWVFTIKASTWEMQQSPKKIILILIYGSSKGIPGFISQFYHLNMQIHYFTGLQNG